MDNLENVIEGILFVAGEGVAYSDIAEKLNIDVKEVESAVEKLKKQHKELHSGIQVITYNSHAQLGSNPEYAEKISEVLNPIKEKQLTRAVLEVAAIIAYKQPITRLDIENVRGVNSDYAINMLLENNLIEVVGRKDAVGKPLLFGTTDNFLKKFNLNDISDLPDYKDLLERIAVIHGEKDNASLFDFTNYQDKMENEENKDSNSSESNTEEELTIPEDDLLSMTALKHDINENMDKLESELDKASSFDYSDFEDDDSKKSE